MARRDVSNTTATTFRELVNQLLAEGFNVDHFHGIAADADDDDVIHINIQGGEIFSWDDVDETTDPRTFRRLVADEWHPITPRPRHRSVYTPVDG